MFDVVCVGNATHDVFLTLHKNHLVHGKNVCFRAGEKREICCIVHATGGGATNASVSFSRLGLKTGILAAVGEDEAGEKIERELRQEKVNTKLMVKLKKFQTAYSAILTGFGADRVILTFGGATTHLERENQVNWEVLGKSKWFYVSSFHSKPKILKKIFSFAKKNGIRIAFNPGMSEISQGLKKLSAMLKKSEILFVNRFESRVLTREKNVKNALKKLQKFTPLVVITDGKHGVHCFDGTHYYFKKTYAIREVDTTGGGDAFNSGFTSQIIRGKKVEDAMNIGMANAESVILHIGAKNKLLRKHEVKGFMKQWETRRTRVKKQKI